MDNPDRAQKQLPTTKVWLNITTEVHYVSNSYTSNKKQGGLGGLKHNVTFIIFQFMLLLFFTLLSYTKTIICIL